MEGYTYEQVLSLAQSWGGVYFMILFVAVCVYALWPSNKRKFDEAARIPLEDEEASS